MSEEPANNGSQPTAARTRDPEPPASTFGRRGWPRTLATRKKVVESVIEPNPQEGVAVGRGHRRSSTLGGSALPSIPRLVVGPAARASRSAALEASTSWWPAQQPSGPCPPVSREKRSSNASTSWWPVAQRALGGALEAISRWSVVSKWVRRCCHSQRQARAGKPTAVANNRVQRTHAARALSGAWSVTACAADAAR